MIELPSHRKEDEFFIFDVDKTDIATIIFKTEGVLKDVLKYVAKEDGRFGNTTTSVITHLVIKGLEEEFNYKFDARLSAMKGARGGGDGEEAIPSGIRNKMILAQEKSNINYYANAIATKEISIAEAREEMDNATSELLFYLSQGYSLDDLHPKKKSYGFDWIYEVSQKTDEDEVVMVNGKEITRKKRLDSDTHYLQYLDNGIEVICPNIFTNAFYKSYSERELHFNNELRKVELQNIEYKQDGNEINSLIDECCPSSKADDLKTYISDKKNIDVIGVHLIKLGIKGERRYRYICLDCYNKADNTYKLIVFMDERGSNKDKTAKFFYGEYHKIVNKKST